MTTILTGAISALAALTLLATPSHAAPDPWLTFTTPSAIVGPNESIPVFLTLSLGQDSDALVIDGDDNVISGFDGSQLPDGFNVDEVVLQQGATCSSFTGNCGNFPNTVPYTFTFFKVAEQGPLLPNLNLQAGASTTFLFGTFSPSQLPVPEGIYNAVNFELTLQVTDFSQPDPDLMQTPENDHWTISLVYANTCNDQDVGCGFQRTVSAVPEPETHLMLLVGLGLVGAIARRRLT